MHAEWAEKYFFLKCKHSDSLNKKKGAFNYIKEQVAQNLVENDNFDTIFRKFL